MVALFQILRQGRNQSPGLNTLRLSLQAAASIRNIFRVQFYFSSEALTDPKNLEDLVYYVIILFPVCKPFPCYQHMITFFDRSRINNLKMK